MDAESKVMGDNLLGRNVENGDRLISVSTNSSGSSRNRKNCRSCCCIVAITLTASFVINLGLITYIAYQHFNKKFPAMGPYSENWQTSAFNASEMSSAVCALCSYIGLSAEMVKKYPDVVKNYIVISVDHGQEVMCCRKNAKSYQRLMTIILPGSLQTPTTSDQHATRDTSKRLVGHQPNAAHLYLNNKSLAGPRNWLDWTTEDGYNTAFETKNVKKNIHGRLCVNENGYYFVYANIIFKTESGANSEEQFTNGLYRQNPNRPKAGRQLLLFDRQTKIEGHMTFQSSYLGATLYLRRQDELYVEVSDTSAVWKSPMCNYFGLYKI